MSKVLVLGRDDRALLAVTRSLGRHGLAVHLAGCPPGALVRHSRYVVGSHELPPYAGDGEAWLRALEALCRVERFDLVVPTSDSVILPLRRHRATLAPLAQLALVDDEAFAIANDKERSHALARSLGIPVPRQRRVALPADAATVRAEFGLPLMLKPRSSFSLDDVETKRFVQPVLTDADLERQLAAFVPDGEVLVQEFFRGTGAGVELLAADGEVLRAFQHLRVHELARGGNSSHRRSVALDPALGAAAAALVRALGYTGVAMIEFRVAPDRSRWVFIEMNPRFWGSLPLAVAAGADFPLHLYQLLVEGRREFPRAYRTGLYCRNWGRDLTWLRDNWRAPRDRRVPLPRLLAELGPALIGRERSDTLTLDDPRPGLEELRRMARRGRARLARGTRALVAAVPPLRRLRAARARRALREARSLLFVCKGNICRSPFAASYSRTLLPASVTVASAGTYPRSGRRCPAEARAAACDAGIDLGAHRSAVLGEELVQGAGAIFVFDRQNWAAVAARWPAARVKLHYLGDLAPDGVREIRDPYGQSLDIFRATYGAIRRTLDDALQGTTK